MNPIEGVEVDRNGFNIDATKLIFSASNSKIMSPLGLLLWDKENDKKCLIVSGHFCFKMQVF